MAAHGANVQIFLIFLDENHLRATWAFVPQRFWCVFLRDEGNAIADAGEPIHARHSFKADFKLAT
jgi:hypothetical protein